MSDEPVLGSYVLLEVVGRGAHGTVHRGRSRDRAGRIVAVKRLTGGADGADLDRLRREAETLAGLGHPAVVSLLEVVDDPDGGTALVLPWAPGGSLEDVLRRDGRLPWPRVADVGARLASALASAHGAGILHGDVKPANVLLGVEGEPRLADFGTARLVADEEARVAGTAEYVDPAVAVDGATPSPRSDVYALGVVLFRALAGQLPHAGGSPEATVAAADPGVHPPLADLVDGAPPALVEAVERAMARDPERRPASVQQLQVVLESVVRDHEADRWAGLGSQLAAPSPGPDDAAAGLATATSRQPGTPTSVASPGAHPASDPSHADAHAGTRDSGTRLFGRRAPSRSTPSADGRRPAWAVPAVVAVALVPVLVVGWLLLGGDGGDADDDAAAPPSASVTTADAAEAAAPRVAAPRCDDASPPPGDGPVHDADVDGRGCSLPVRVDEQDDDGRPTVVITLPDAAGEAAGRYALAEPGEVVLVGDFDCDGIETPAVHRPDDGRVLLYDGYGALEPTAGPDLDPGATAVVLRDVEGCDTVGAF
jgi:serine/threonine protein kinase